jgi:hypothetical protein
MNPTNHTGGDPMDADSLPASFYHPRNISYGRGRILWAKAATCCSGILHPEGWVLPGGERTQNRNVAQAAAIAIDEMSSELAA